MFAPAAWRGSQARTMPLARYLMVHTFTELSLTLFLNPFSWAFALHENVPVA